MQDMGTVVSGKLQSGSVSKGDTVILMPNKTKVIVDTIFSDDQERASAQSGDNVKVRQFLDVITAFGRVILAFFALTWKLLTFL